MTKYYKKSKFANKLTRVYARLYDSKEVSVTGKSKNKYVKTLIVRGIGYRTFALKNDIANTADSSKGFINSTRPVFSGAEFDENCELTQACALEFPADRYLSVRAGHTKDLYLPLQTTVNCITSKKDRKLTISCRNKMLSANLAKVVYVYRPPSVYTGRGVRVKHERPVRKAGKKDKQKGRAF